MSLIDIHVIHVNISLIQLQLCDYFGCSSVVCWESSYLHKWLVKRVLSYYRSSCWMSYCSILLEVCLVVVIRLYVYSLLGIPPYHLQACILQKLPVKTGSKAKLSTKNVLSSRKNTILILSVSLLTETFFKKMFCALSTEMVLLALFLFFFPLWPTKLDWRENFWPKVSFNIKYNEFECVFVRE